MVKYPEGPFPPQEIPPGQGINAKPLEAEELLDFTAPLGKCTGVYYSLMFQLPKWGFARFKIDEWIFVSPVFREYYELTLRQKEALEATIKAGLASVATAISDLELIIHDLGRYKEFLDYYAKIERGKKLIKEGKKEEGEKLVKEGDQSLKSAFIDLVDAHTGPGIALREIAVRWPTIIADFMKLSDEDTEPEKIAKKLNVSEAEGVVLATKNKLYLEWRDRLFGETVKNRYRSLRQLVEARRKSVEEYKEMLKPSIARYKMINDALSSPEGRASIFKLFFRPDTQALSIDFMRVYAWKPFAVEEKYKIVRESFDKIPLAKAGFNKEEIEYIFEKKGEGFDGYVKALPVEPSIDDLVRKMIPEIEDEFKVKLTPLDLLQARNMLIDQFEKSKQGLGVTEAWVFSPYYVFLDIPISRTVLRIPPAGPEIENITVDTLKAYTQTQNLIICHCLELIARDKQLDNYINQMLGEAAEGKPIKELLAEEFPEIYGEREKKEKPKVFLSSSDKAYLERRKFLEEVKKIKEAIGNFFKTLGFEVAFFRAYGPYEFIPNDRLTKFYQPVTGRHFALVANFLKTKFEVPGFETYW
ncbi:MAG: hypothetical protein NZ942_00700 [Candidatus Aenigmarchaeota archaeon]|nr:hypothetical protein [Candidatus Aenigmarchaeota archaeon]